MTSWTNDCNSLANAFYVYFAVLEKECKSQNCYETSFSRLKPKVRKRQVNCTGRCENHKKQLSRGPHAPALFPFDGWMNECVLHWMSINTHSSNNFVYLPSGAKYEASFHLTSRSLETEWVCVCLKHCETIWIKTKYHLHFHVEGEIVELFSRGLNRLENPARTWISSYLPWG
jgi:hypothetical protein